MAKYRKIPVTIEAFLWTGDADQIEDPEWIIEAIRSGRVWFNHPQLIPCMYINTLEGVMRAEPGDYIIQGIAGEIYPCKPDIFAKTYELVEE